MGPQVVSVIELGGIATGRPILFGLLYDEAHVFCAVRETLCFSPDMYTFTGSIAHVVVST
jgi:hypothetical protein